MATKVGEADVAGGGTKRTPSYTHGAGPTPRRRSPRWSSAR